MQKKLLTWLEMSLKSCPKVSGVYGVYLPDTDEWFYIGESVDIFKRISSKTHPAHVADSLNIRSEYYYIPVKANLLRDLERAIISLLEPIGNGGTSFSPPIYKGVDGSANRPLYPTCQISGDSDEEEYIPETLDSYYEFALRIYKETCAQSNLLPGSIEKSKCVYYAKRLSLKDSSGKCLARVWTHKGEIFAFKHSEHCPA